MAVPLLTHLHHLPPRLQSALTLHLLHHVSSRQVLHRRKRKAENGVDPLIRLQKRARGQVCEGKPMPTIKGATSPQDILLAAALKGDVSLANAVYEATPAEQHAEITNHQDPVTGRTPLSLACERGKLGMVRLLMTKGADVYLNDADTNISPLMWASGCGHAGITAVLLAEGEADAFFPATSGRTAAMEAARGGHTACLELLLEMGGIDVRQANDLDGTHPMLEAAAHGHLDALKVLMRTRGAKVNQTDKSGQTCLLLAARNGDVRMLEVLLQAGAKSIPEFVHYHTPLHAAASNGHLPACVTLIRAQGVAATQALDRNGKTPADMTGLAHVRAACRVA
ncbi:ankyrin repeat-containing domain protein [Dunaliella salina]|uniref:Ankyrin repeat-containing domain protein n=1 Tax=Dunaliella salina TaxID=3046 RepID=A0ABQ7H095_DUNSA|nr:ankyrin repeat-containing domain protein [Dunaliella salina]|eukprot:KAF5840270.1 ankyrin repeat-containing domain protein [Dunaliella salina]